MEAKKKKSQGKFWGKEKSQAAREGLLSQAGDSEESAGSWWPATRMKEGTEGQMRMCHDPAWTV